MNVVRWKVHLSCTHPLLLDPALCQNNYPELMYKTLIINAPATFRVLWAMVRHLLDARTQAKIQVGALGSLLALG